jgi:hypothetical protein
MVSLLVGGCRRTCKLLPVASGSKSIEVHKCPAIQNGSGYAQDSTKTDHCFFIHFVSTQQILVITEVAEEPVEPPDRSRCAVEAALDRTAGIPAWLEDEKAHSVEGTPRMPAVEDAIDADQEDSLQDVRLTSNNTAQARDVSLHECTS